MFYIVMSTWLLRGETPLEGGLFTLQQHINHHHPPSVGYGVCLQTGYMNTNLLSYGLQSIIQGQQRRAGLFFDVSGPLFA